MPTHNYLIARFKKGNSKSGNGFMDGMFTDYIDPNVYNPVISKFELETFLHVQVPYSLKPDLDQAGQPSHDLGFDERIPVDYKPRFKCIDIDAVCDATGDLTLKTKVRNWEDVGIIDGLNFDKTILLDTSTRIFPNITDRNVITSGSATVGSGGTYSTWVAAFADLGNLTGNLTFTQISATSETAAAQMTESLGGFTFTITSDTPHNGNPNAGWITSWTGNHHGIIFNTTGNGTIEVMHLSFARTGAASGKRMLWVNITSSTTTVKLHHILIDGRGQTGTNGGAGAGSSGTTLEIYRLKIWDCPDTGWSTGSSMTALTFENNVIRNCGDGLNCGGGTGPFTFNNNTCIVNTTDINSPTNHIGRNNSTSDTTCANGNWTTGTNNNVSIIEANEFISTTDTNDRFLDTKEGGVNDDSGLATVIADNDFGSRGNAVPNTQGNVSIGADQFEDNEGTLGVTLPAPTVSFTGTLKHTGTLGLTLPVPTVSLTGILKHTGTFSLNLPIITINLTGVLKHSGTFDLNLPLVQASFTGVFANTGTISLTLPVPTASFTGILKHTGTMGLTLPIVQVLFTGTLKHTGTLGLTLPQVQVLLTGTLKHTGTFLLTLPIVQANFLGTSINTGTLGLTLPSIQASFTGILKHTGTFAFVLPQVQVGLTGVLIHTGTLGVSLPIPTASLTGNFKFTGTLGVTLPIVIVSISGVEEIIEILTLDSTIVTQITLNSTVETQITLNSNIQD